MAEKFDWSDKEAQAQIPVRSIQGVAVYTNPDGDIVIRQQAGALEDEDSIVVIPTQCADVVAAAILREARG
jgi:hypothetical protein